ncbi:MAG: sulfatase [Ilumatobacter sp.]
MRRGLVVIVSVCSVLWALVQPSMQADAERPQQPNVIVILTDDQTVADMQFMPKTSALLGANGTTYTNSWTSLSWCCPSRATLQSGQHAHNHGVFGNEAPAGGFGRFDHETALPVWLSDAGYRTIHIGKAMNDTGRTLPAGWDRWQSTLAGDHKMYNWRTIDEHGRVTRYGSADDDYQGDVYAQMVVDEIRASEASEQPFFVHFALSAPHVGVGKFATPPRRHLKTIDAPLPQPPSFNEPANFSRTEINNLAKQYQRRAESLLGADDGIEQIVDALSDTDQLDDTVIIFTSDNGFLLGEHGQYGKSTYWHEAMAVPLLIRGPGFGAGVVETAPVQNIDLAPTIADLAGATPLVTVDGQSLLDPISPDRGLFFESKRDDPNEALWEGVRSDRFVLVEAERRSLLWDMDLDPWQLNDLIDDPDYDAVQAALEAELDAVRDCSGVDCSFEIDNELLEALVSAPPTTISTTTMPTTTTTAPATTMPATTMPATTMPGETTTTTVPPETTTTTTTTTVAPTTTNPPTGDVVVVDELPPWRAGFTVTREGDDVDVTIDPLSLRTATRFQVRWKVEGDRWTFEPAGLHPTASFSPGAGTLLVEVRVYGNGAWRFWHRVVID